MTGGHQVTFGVLATAGVLVLVQAMMIWLPRDENLRAALDAANSCQAAVDLLGPEIRQRLVGLHCGQSTSHAGGFGHAGWTIGVSGQRQDGRLEYSAESHAGRWEVVGAQVRVGDELASVIPCRPPPP